VTVCRQKVGQVRARSDWNVAHSVDASVGTQYQNLQVCTISWCTDLADFLYHMSKTSADIGYRRLPSALLIDDCEFAISIYFILNTPLLYHLSLILRTFTNKFANGWRWLLSDSHWVLITRRHDSQQLWLQ